jgi:hypothetical protein
MRRARLTVALANELANQAQPGRAMALYSGVIQSQPTLQNAPLTEALIGRARLHRGSGRFGDAQRDAARAAQLGRASAATLPGRCASPVRRWRKSSGCGRSPPIRTIA